MPACIYGGVVLLVLRVLFDNVGAVGNYWNEASDDQYEEGVILMLFFISSLYLSMDLRFTDLWHEAGAQLCLMQVMCWSQYIISVIVVAVLSAVGFLDAGTNSAFGVLVTAAIEGAKEIVAS